MTTAMGGSQKACVHLTRLKSPEEINSMNHPVGDTEVPCIFDFTPDISINIGSKPGNTFWASSARPRDTSSEFALATSAGTILIAENQASYSFERTQTFGSGLVEGHSEVLAVDWLDTNVTLNGHRNGKVKLWDARTEGPEGTSSRVQHPSTITHVRRTNDHKIAVAGLENQLCIYDMRFLTQKVPFVDGPTNPYLRFHSYQNWGLTGLAVGFDVCRGLIAAGADRDMMQLFDSERGGELKMSPQLELRKRDSLWPARCIRFAEGESTREAPKLFVAAGDFTEKWAW